MLGIIPAAGKGARWGGYFKELLPTGNGRWLIDSAVDALTAGGCDQICIVTSPEKIGIHAAHFEKPKYNGKDIFFVINRNMHHDIFGSIEATFPYVHNRNLLTFADTMIPESSFVDLPDGGFSLGVHMTDMPERFGVISNGRVIDKSSELAGQQLPAWGTLCWSRAVVDYWVSMGVHDYTEAINLAIHKFGYNEKKLEFYYDFAAWADYLCWIKLQ